MSAIMQKLRASQKRLLQQRDILDRKLEELETAIRVVCRISKTNVVTNKGRKFNTKWLPLVKCVFEILENSTSQTHDELLAALSARGFTIDAKEPKRTLAYILLTYRRSKHLAYSRTTGWSFLLLPHFEESPAPTTGQANGDDGDDDEGWGEEDDDDEGCGDEDDDDEGCGDDAPPTNILVKKPSRTVRRRAASASHSR